MKNTIRLLFITIFISLFSYSFANTEYTIMPFTLGDPTKGEVAIINTTDSGYLLGKMNDTLIVYHPTMGLRELKELPSNATGIVNEAGIIAGVIGKSDNPWTLDPVTAFTFDLTTNTYTDLENCGLANGYLVDILGFSDPGLILFKYAIGNYVERFIYDMRTKNVDHNLPDAWTYTMNKKGLIIGRTLMGGFIFSTPLLGQSKLRQFSFIPSGYNDHGDVCGTRIYAYPENSVSIIHFDGNIQKIMLRQDPNVFSHIMGINNSGELFGTFSVYAVHCEEDKKYMDKLVFRGPKGGLTIVNQNPNHHFWPRSMNNLGQIVGTIVTEEEENLIGWDPDDEPGEHEYFIPLRHAFIWSKDEGLQNLNDLIPAETGWDKLIKAEKITDTGMIVGEGIYQGSCCTFIMMPNE